MKTILLKVTVLFCTALLLGIINSCIGKTEDFTLSEWLSEKKIVENEIFHNTYASDLLINKIEKFKDEDFRNIGNIFLAKHYLQQNNLQKSEEYLKKYLEMGKHISWIDSTRFALIYPSKVEANHLYQKYWKNRDTSYFEEIEARVVRDQASIDSYVTNPTTKHLRKEKQIFNENSKYLLKISNEFGFPWKPGPNNFKKELFRNGIQPDLIAVHSPIPDKMIHLHNAVVAAKKRRISWKTPIFIGVSFFTQLPKSEVLPMRLIYYKENDQLDLEKSYLQLYSIKKFMEDNGIILITIQPSKANNLNTNLVTMHLKTLEDILIQEFGLNNSVIQLSQLPDSNENVKKHQKEGEYKYTLTVNNFK